jgi:hypothetical protein
MRTYFVLIAASIFLLTVFCGGSSTKTKEEECLAKAGYNFTPTEAYLFCASDIANDCSKYNNPGYCSNMRYMATYINCGPLMALLKCREKSDY